MQSRVQKAKEDYFKYGCAGAILVNYKDLLGISEEEAIQKGRPLSGGRGVKCGAILAVEEILKEKAPEKIEELEKRFKTKNSSIFCRDLRGLDTGVRIIPCTSCVEDAATILEELLKEE
ncbi:MAG: C_GCAxxG_C_C family protein [Bacilli bacterium]|nr:C_GCAxxG_C_C family protein [Bacilli bacterium]